MLRNIKQKLKMVHIIAAHKDGVRKYVNRISQNLQSVCLINQVLLRRFRSYGSWLNKWNHQVKEADIS